MAEPITIQKLIEASMDSDSLEVLVNGDENEQVTTRLGETYPSAKKAIKTLFENGGLPATPFATKALMTASALVDGDYAQVTDGGADNGLYIKTAGAWVKSDYDPLVSSKSFTANVADVFDASKATGNYSLTFTEALAAIPKELKVKNVKLRYNNTEVRQFINDEVSGGELVNWSNERFWLRPKEATTYKLNHIDESMIYNFTLGLGNTINHGVDNYCIIIPIKRTYTDGVLNKLNIAAYPTLLKPTNWLPLYANGKSAGQLPNLVKFSNYTIPTGVDYIAINLEWRDTNGVLVNAGNLEIAKRYLKYIPDNSNPVLSKAAPIDGFDSLEYGIAAPIQADYARGGVTMVSPYFKSGLSPIDGLHIAQIVKHVEVQKGQRDLIVASTGQYRRIQIQRIALSSDRATAQAYVAIETIDGVMSPNFPVTAPVDASSGLAKIEWVKETGDILRVRLTLDVNSLPNGAVLVFNENGELHPSVIEKADRVRDVNKGSVFNIFTDVGIAKTVSNQAVPTQPESAVLNRSFANGFISQSITGDVGKDHQQTTLITSKLARFHGKASIYADAKAAYPSNPAVKLLREEGGAPYNDGSPAGVGVLGKTMPSQWIHPDMTYIPEGVAGYKYWMINSNFPNGAASQEDANLFVSNNGTDWTRVRSFYESSDAGLGFKTPEVFWNSNYRDGFMPIPINGNSFEFALESTIETKTVTGFLCHDPAISHHNGYVNFYVLYNLGFVNLNYDHKYVVCYRTNDGINWEIVREDGTTMPYNQANAQLIFTKTNGVRNHLWYNDLATVIGGSPASPQVVKVSDTEWYYYARESKNITPSSGNTMFLARYSGTSPYTFDWSSRVLMSKDTETGGVFWHFGMQYYNGVYYCLTHGFMFTSTDGINFTTVPNPFFWRGMSSDIYKPTFVVGHDSKVKIAYSIQSHFAVPHPYNPQKPATTLDANRMQNNLKITSTLITEYSSLANIMSRGTTETADGYVDVVVMAISQRTKSTRVAVMPCLRSYSELLSYLDVSYDDELYVTAYLNTRHGGKVDFSGVAVTLPNSAVN